jgi:KDO2-lipid IV(A) lauroyltransferase
MSEGKGGWKKRFAHDGALFRRLAASGSRRLPRWWVRHSPPFFGIAAAIALPDARRSVRDNLRRIRGEASAFRDAYETAQTFATYASCLADTLAAGSKNAVSICAETEGSEHMDAALALRKGCVLLTMHTAGWELATPSFARASALDVLVVMQSEPHADAQRIQNEARAAMGVKVVVVGDDPLAALPLVAHLKRGGAVALQADRVPPSGRALAVTLAGSPARIPEGPFRLAQLTGASIVPTFSARLGPDRYLLVIYPRVEIARRASALDLEAAAQQVADAMSAFLRRFPTQWFHFGERS